MSDVKSHEEVDGSAADMETIPTENKKSEASWSAEIISDGALIRTVTVNSIAALFARCASI